MEPLELSRGYRWYGLVFGVLLPVVVWGAIVIDPPMDEGDSRPSLWFARVQAVFVLIEVAVLSRWLWKPTRKPSSERVIGVILSLGALFAGGWCLLGLWVIVAEAGVGSLIFWPLAMIPLPCLVTYGLSALHACSARR